MKLSVIEEIENDAEYVPYEIKDIATADLEIDTSWFNKPQTWIVILVIVMLVILVYACFKKRQKSRRGHQEIMNAYI